MRAGTLKGDLNRGGKDRHPRAETKVWNQDLGAGKSRVSSGNGQATQLDEELELTGAEAPVRISEAGPVAPRDLEPRAPPCAPGH